MTIKISKTPSQVIPLVIQGMSLRLYIKSFRGNVFCSIREGSEYIVASRRVVAEENIFYSSNLKKKYGTLRFRSKYDTPINDFKEYGNAVYLEYLNP